MIRAYAPPAAWGEVAIALPEEEARHLVRVRRARVGDPVEVVDGVGGRAHGVLESIERRTAGVRIERRETEPPPRADLGLIVAALKGDKGDWIIQKATELGMSRIWTVESERSIARVDPERLDARLERWRKTAIEAIKQCGRARLPELRLFSSVAELADARAPDDGWVVGALTPQARPLREVLEELTRTGAPRIAAVIGPEGDFTPDEYRRLQAAGAAPVSFGPNVLRAETAALFAASALSLFFNPGTLP